jgi:hypothetical protein
MPHELAVENKLPAEISVAYEKALREAFGMFPTKVLLDATLEVDEESGRVYATASALGNLAIFGSTPAGLRTELVKQLMKL